VVIRISICTQDRIEGFFTIARESKLKPNIALPNTTEKIDISLAEVCSLRVPFIANIIIIIIIIIILFVHMVHTYKHTHKNIASNIRNSSDLRGCWIIRCS